MMDKDPRKAAEAFIEKVVVPRRRAPCPDRMAARARAELDREDLELAKRELVATGLDPNRVDKLAAERSKLHKKLAEETRRKAVESSAEAARRLKDRAPVILPIDPIDTVIDQVTFIRTFADQGELVDSNIGPSDNWAKYRMEHPIKESPSDESPGDESPGDAWYGIGRLSFFTLWQNRQTSPTIVMARPNLVINALLSVGADGNGIGSWFGFTSEGRASVRARTTVWSMDSSVSTIVHDQVVGEAAAYGTFFGGSDSASIEFNELLAATGVAVQAQAYTLIEVELRTEWAARHGSIDLDAESESYRVDLPQLVLTEMRSPPISLTAVVDYGTTPATVTLIFGGATSTMVDIYQNGVRLGDTENDGTWSYPINPGTHTFRVCETLTSVCSADVTVTVT